MNTNENLEQEIGLVSTANHFINSNTVDTSLEEIKSKHVIPVFTKFNEPLISHSDFVGLTHDIISELFKTEVVNDPIIKVSHPVKGRIPEAKLKPASELLDSEKTLYYERMAFLIEIPTICDLVEDNPLMLTVGGVKAYNLDNYNSNRKDQHFKVFIGLKNSVCTNLCIRTDGLKAEISVKSITELCEEILTLVGSYNVVEHLAALKRLGGHKINENLLAILVGRLKMYSHLSKHQKKHIPDIMFNDGQLNQFVNAIYHDPNFKMSGSGSTTLWRLYNNATEAVKSSYIDGFLNKNQQAFSFFEGLAEVLEGRSNKYDWYLN